MLSSHWDSSQEVSEPSLLNSTGSLAQIVGMEDFGKFDPYSPHFRSQSSACMSAPLSPPPFVCLDDSDCKYFRTGTVSSYRCTYSAKPIEMVVLAGPLDATVVIRRILSLAQNE